MVIHNQSDSPFALNSGLNIQPGFDTYIGVKREFTNKLGSPYSNCLTDLTPPNEYANELFGYFNELNVTYYDQTFCFKMCYQDKLIDSCSCCDIITPSIRNASYCSNSSELMCMNNFLAFFTTADLNYLCDNACPLKCNVIEYPLSLSMAVFPTINYVKNQQTTDKNLQLFPQNVSDLDLLEFASKGFLKFTVNYDNLYYTSIDDSPAMSSNDLFGNLGGQLGLFVGLSVLSFAEVIELTIKFFITIFNYLKKRKLNTGKVSNISK